MTVIAFPHPSSRPEQAYAGSHLSVTGAFQSPRGRSGHMNGILRVRRLLPSPGGVSVTGVITAELREADGGLIGVDSRRATLTACPVRGERGLQLVVDPLELDLMGITVRVQRFTIEPPVDLPTFDALSGRSASRRRSAQGGGPS
ncbi:MAG TPA: hypothetical protein VE503_01360 [Ornithinibacter sp.]|jgi:hypothetical protein|nr:hypothetical protein [Ornithinibacter sp.]